MPVTATAGQFAAGNMSVGLGPGSDKVDSVNFYPVDCIGVAALDPLQPADLLARPALRVSEQLLENLR